MERSSSSIIHRLVVVLFLVLKSCRLGQTDVSNTAFGVSRTTDWSTLGTIPFPVIMSNVDGSFNATTRSFAVRSSGLHFVFFCAGVSSGMRTVLKKSGGYPSMTYQWWSTSHRAVRTGCRAGVMRLTTGTSAKINYFSGTGVYSSSLAETAFSGFSLSDSMDSELSNDGTLYVTGALSSSTASTNPYVNTVSYNTAVNCYKCPKDGFYMFSFSADIDPATLLVMQLQEFDNSYSVCPLNSGGSPPVSFFELTRNTTATNGVTTLSRSVLFSCSSGNNIQLMVTYGQLSRPDLVSLTVVPYVPVGQSAAWALYSTRSLTTANQAETVVFDNVEIESNVEIVGNSSVNITHSGTYMVYLSAATLPGEPINLLMTNNGATIMGLNSTLTETDGVDMMDHGVIVELNVGDVLEVSVQAQSSVSSNDGQQVGFWGYLIYG